MLTPYKNVFTCVFLCKWCSYYLYVQDKKCIAYVPQRGSFMLIAFYNELDTCVADVDSKQMSKIDANGIAGNVMSTKLYT